MEKAVDTPVLESISFLILIAIDNWGEKTGTEALSTSQTEDCCLNNLLAQLAQLRRSLDDVWKDQHI